MKKLALLLVLLVSLCLRTYATDISVQSTTFDWSDSRTTGLQLWIFSDQSWIDINSVPHGPGNYRDRIFTQRVSGLTNNTTTHKLTIPAFSLTPTLNAIRGTSVKLSFWIMQVIGQTVTPIKQVPGSENGFRIPATLTSGSGCSPSPTCATWADLTVLNSPSPALPRERFATFDDVTRLITAALATAQGPAPSDATLQFNNNGVFGSVTNSTVSGADITLQGNLSVRLPVGTKFFAGPASQRLTLNPYSTDVSGPTNTGAAPLLFESTFHYTNSSDFRSVGFGARPSFGSTTGGEGVFWTPYWFLFGNSATPIPAGTKGNPSGYEANIFTSQTQSDMSEAVHAFGATIVGHGGAAIYGTAITVTTDTVSTNIINHNANITKNVAGGTQYAYYASSSGSQPPTAGMALTGTWNYGIDLNSAIFTVGGIRVKNNAPALLGRNSADSGDVVMMYLDINNHLVFGGQMINNTADPYVQVGDDSTGWLFQKVDSDSRWRMFKQGLGEVLNLKGTEPTDGNTSMQLRVQKGGVVSLVQVSLGAADSGGTGFRILRIPN